MLPPHAILNTQQTPKEEAQVPEAVPDKAEHSVWEVQSFLYAVQFRTVPVCSRCH